MGKQVKGRRAQSAQRISLNVTVTTTDKKKVWDSLLAWADESTGRGIALVDLDLAARPLRVSSNGKVWML